MPSFGDKEAALYWVQDCPLDVLRMARIRQFVSDSLSENGHRVSFQDIEDYTARAMAIALT